MLGLLVSGDSDASPEGPGAAAVLPSFREPKPSEVEGILSLQGS